MEIFESFEMQWKVKIFQGTYRKAVDVNKIQFCSSRYEYRNEYRINSVCIHDDDILKLIRNLNPVKLLVGMGYSGKCF